MRPGLDGFGIFFFWTWVYRFLIEFKIYQSLGIGLIGSYDNVYLFRINEN